MSAPGFIVSVRYEDPELLEREFKRARAAIESMNPANYMASRSFRSLSQARRFAATVRGAVIQQIGIRSADGDVVAAEDKANGRGGAKL